MPAAGILANSFLAGTEDSILSTATPSLLLGTGGDRRIWPDPVTRRNRYGTLSFPAPDEVSFASTTASNVSADGYHAVSQALSRLSDPVSATGGGIDIWFDDLRTRIGATIGYPAAEVLLAASGTDVELMAAALLAGLDGRPLVNIVIAPDETGSGVLQAASGRHFADVSALGEAVVGGSMLAGLSVGPAEARIDVRTVAIRDESGRPRSAQSVDDDVLAMVGEALKADCHILVHVLDTSKTGLFGVTRQAARQALALAPERVHVLVDACQFRCQPSALRQDLADGFMVAITGSKFIGGPPFSGALLVPAAFAGVLTGARTLAGLSGYCAAYDFPPALRSAADAAFAEKFNLGLGLRWTAALAGVERLSAVNEVTQAIARQGIVDLMRSMVGDARGLTLHPDDDSDRIAASAILSFTVLVDGRPATFEQAQGVQQRMRSGENGPVCHVGQAVRLGDRAVLRLAASAQDVAETGEALAAGLTIAQALAPVQQRLETVFTKMDRVLRQEA